MVPSRENRGNREELSTMRERWLGPGLYNDLVSFLVVCAIAFLILDSCKRPSEDFCLTRLIAAADSKLEASTAYHIKHRGLLGNSDRMPPGYDVRSLTKTDLTRARRDRGFREERIWAELRAF